MNWPLFALQVLGIIAAVVLMWGICDLIRSRKR